METFERSIPVTDHLLPSNDWHTSSDRRYLKAPYFVIMEWTKPLA